jgi:hypothetical protein
LKVNFYKEIKKNMFFSIQKLIFISKLKKYIFKIPLLVKRIEGDCFWVKRKIFFYILLCYIVYLEPFIHQFIRLCDLASC